MSDEKDDHASVVNSTLTELVLILLFGFMLVSVHFGSKAKNVMDQAAAAIADKDAQIEDWKKKYDKLVGVRGDRDGKVRDPHWPPCWAKEAGVREGVYVLITTKVDGERLTIRLNDEHSKYQGDRSLLNLSPDLTASLQNPKEYRLDELRNLVLTLREAIKGNENCNIDLSVPYGSQLPGTMHQRLSALFTLGYYTPRRRSP